MPPLLNAVHRYLRRNLFTFLHYLIEFFSLWENTDISETGLCSAALKFPDHSLFRPTFSFSSHKPAFLSLNNKLRDMKTEYICVPVFLCVSEEVTKRDVAPVMRESRVTTWLLCMLPGTLLGWSRCLQTSHPEYAGHGVR